MSVAVREFSSVNELLKFLDDEIANYRRVLGEMLKRLEELRVRAEQEKKLKSVLAKLGLPETQTQNEVALRNIRIVVNPSASQELAALEQAVESLNSRITQLIAIRKEVETLSNIDVEAKIALVYVDNMPRIVLLRM
jgi:prefoldin subunit 5